MLETVQGAWTAIAEKKAKGEREKAKGVDYVMKARLQICPSDCMEIAFSDR